MSTWHEQKKNGYGQAGTAAEGMEELTRANRDAILAGGCVRSQCTRAGHCQGESYCCTWSNNYIYIPPEIKSQ
jgi:hypothetical protein